MVGRLYRDPYNPPVMHRFSVADISSLSVRFNLARYRKWPSVEARKRVLVLKIPINLAGWDQATLAWSGGYIETHTTPL